MCVRVFALLYQVSSFCRVGFQHLCGQNWAQHQRRANHLLGAWLSSATLRTVCVHEIITLSDGELDVSFFKFVNKIAF